MNKNRAGRRRFFELVTPVLIAAIGLIVAIPGVGYVFAPLRRRGSSQGVRPGLSDAGPLSDIPIGEWRFQSVEVVHQDGWKKARVRHAIWVRRQNVGDEGITVLSSICPHLGCPINWDLDQSQFFCPCHGGIFAADGRQIGGPPPRPMDPLSFEVRAGRLWVRWQDFKIGVGERIPVSV